VHVVFGYVIEGASVVREIERVNTNVNGHPLSKVIISHDA